MKVRDIMHTSVVTLHSSDKLSVADDIMTMGRLRHLPVVDGHYRVVGIVTQRDLYKVAISSVLGFDQDKEHEWLGKVAVADVMTKEVVTVAAEAGVIETVDQLLTMKIGCLPVVDAEGKLIGMITETDCLRCFRDLLKMGAFKDTLS
jgi:CBS-domain-containing membrane protein